MRLLTAKKMHVPLPATREQAIPYLADKLQASDACVAIANATKQSCALVFGVRARILGGFELGL